ERSLSITEEVPRKADARRKMGVAGWNAATFDTWIAEELRTDRRKGIDRGLHTRHIVDDAIERIGWWRLHIPSQTKIEGQAWANFEIILHKECRVPAIGVARYGRVLRDRAGDADEEICQRVTGRSCYTSASHPCRCTCIESENAVVVKQCLLDVLVERDLSPQLERVIALDPTENVACGVKVSTGYRATDLFSQGKVSSDGDLRQIRRALDHKCRTQIGKRDRGIVYAAAKIP